MPRAEGKEADEAEHGGSDEEEEVVGGEVDWKDRIEPAIKFFDGKDLNGMLDDFVQEHKHEFEEAAEAKTDEEVEHKLVYTDLHARYLRIFETELDQFLEGEGCSSAEFYAQCKDAIEDNYTALFEEHQHHWFVDALLASMSYEHFFEMMTKAAREWEGGGGIGGGGAGHK
mmetsp:Transcript_50583/g.142298  ORF Transcript_50583/g.142298 Transcript_50583/m.142298 type:complete len:171 (+) Transcript_50583:69-581(+)|eukprot:CAMPEP_0119515538 /NCGR_PEP_ID=MMETSP1344-20130328/32997_1 /TAXON_ID=236787 /ORGANISM="Florenciella parvula, Strain CCMP2471" /LENGTH=170 /DNA_ID=CAMNT_0007552953 /DNA_START=57 /DNA_END=569 /DNA_ORIENTATION=+